ETLGAALRGETLPELADQILGRSVMIGEIPAREASIVIPEHRIDGRLGVDPAMRARHLPHSVQHTADAQARRELKPARRGQRHQMTLFAFSAARSAALYPSRP